MNSIPYMTFSIRPGMLMKFEGEKKAIVHTQRYRHVQMAKTIQSKLNE